MKANSQRPVPPASVLDSVIQLTSSKKIQKQVQKIAALKVSDAMTPEPVAVQPDTHIETVAALMVDSNFHTLPVVEGPGL